ncbi:MAG: (Fe-S)-binding protein [Terracidiphilus sp.]
MAIILFSATLAEPQHFSLAEKALFLALAAGSLALFWRRFGPILHRILQSRKDPGFHLDHVGRRAWDFFAEVLCQAKVIRQRPLPGLAHAFVFWGFCAFVLVTLNHWADGLGLAFLNPASWFGRIYFYTAAAFALACAIGIFALLVRRFLVRPRWLGKKVSIESGVIAGLIFLLMVTYLAAFFTTESSPAARALWWIHTLTLLVFLPIIPKTKHLHLLLSPVTVFLSRGSFSRIPPLVGDEDFGLVAGKDLTRIVSLQAYSCVECGRCSEHCPATNTGKELNPKEIILGVRNYLNGPGPHAEDPLLGKYNSQKAVFQCTTCGACEFQCPVGIEHVPIMVGLRRGAVNTGTWEDDYGSKLFNQLERGTNALGISALERDKFIQKQQFPIFDGTQEYCLWLGCMGGYDPKGREIVTAFAKVMNYLGASFGVLKKEKCTGDPVRRLGNDLVFQTLAEENLKNLAQNKVKRIVSICPHCVRTIQEDWKAYGTPPEIEHHTEFMARSAERLPRFQPISIASGQDSGTRASGQNSGTHASGHDPQTDTQRSGIAKVSGHDFSRAESSPKKDGALAPAPAPETIVFHDPCYLGRYRNVYDQPRQLVQIAGTLLEAPRHKERSFCCGAGGGLAFLGEETGERVSHARAKELVATGAQTIGTACPFCNSMFRDALGEMNGAAPQLLDVAQLIARNLPEPIK